MQVERDQFVRLQSAYSRLGGPSMRLALPNLYEPWMLALAESFCALADAGGMATQISVTRSDPAAEVAAAALCESNNESGLVIVDPGGPLYRPAELCRVAAIGRATAHDAVAWFAVDEVHGMSMLMQHLRRAGHESIAFVEPELRTGPRRSAYLDQMFDAGSASLIRLIHCPPGSPLQAVADSILTADSRPTAVVGANDHTALRIIAALELLGRVVPDDIAVAGYGNGAKASAGLTTVDVRVDRLVSEAVAWITSAEPPRTRMFEPHLVVRHSA